MLSTLPKKFREYQLPVDIRTLLLFRQSMERGLVHTLGDAYNVLKHIIVKDPKMLGPFTRAYYDYFLNITLEPGEKLDDAIFRSDAFKNWREDYLKRYPGRIDEEKEIQVERFLNSVHLSHYDIKEIISGKDIFDNNDAEQSDEESDDQGEPKYKQLNKMADYSMLSLEELMERLEAISKQQKSRHGGGSHWIGTGGISAFGHGGAAKGGVRVGGSGGGKMARKVINDRNFYPVEMDSIINDNNVDAALASLKGVFEESAKDILDVNKTISEGLKKGGLFLPELKKEIDKKLQVILLIDNGGYSMTPYIQTVRELFKKMKTRFSHDMKVYYFHNTIYERVYKDNRRTKAYAIDQLLSQDPNYKVFIIGDAAMAPYELNRTSIKSLKRLQKKFKKIIWFNPEPKRFWQHSFTTEFIRKIIPMYPLTPRGIEQAIVSINKKSN